MASLSDRGLVRFSVLERLPDVRHAFADAAALSGFDAARVEDRARLAHEVMGEACRLAPTHQTHSANVAVVPRENVHGDAGIDGLVTREPGILLHAISADCPLLYLALGGSARGVALAHCGWRGIARGIVSAALRRLCDEAGAKVSDVVAAISPGAGGCCYEVGDEVREGLAGAGVRLDACVLGRRVDLKAAIAGLLESSGVPAASIEISPACTICGGASYHSYRRTGGRAGRMSAVIGIS